MSLLNYAFIVASTTYSNSRQKEYERHFKEMQNEQRIEYDQFTKQAKQLEESTKYMIDGEKWLKKHEKQRAEYENA